MRDVARGAGSSKGFDPIETASRDEIAALQLERLKWSVAHAYRNVEHYRKVFDGAGAHPDDIRTVADLARFPFLNKSDLRDHYPFGLFAVPREQLVRIHASSGTTGKPTVVGYTRGDIDTWANLVARSIYASGGRPGDIVHVAYGYGLFTGGLGAHYGAERLGCSVVPMSGMVSRNSTISPFSVFGPSVGRLQRIERFSARIVAEALTTKQPSSSACTSRCIIVAGSVVNSPTISSRMSSSVTSPWMSPYSSTTNARRRLLRWKFSSCVFSVVPDGT